MRRLIVPLVVLTGVVVLAILFIGGGEGPGLEPQDTKEPGRERKKPSVELPANTLDRTQVMALFEDRTVESRTVNKRRFSVTYYHPEGEVRQLRDDNKRYGFWRVRPNGRICLQMETLKEKCRIIVRVPGGSYRKYIVRKNGQHQPTVDYVRFWKGNTFDI